MAKVYIAGPITGVPDYRIKFAAAAAELRSKDHIVFNPATMPEGLPGEAYMPICYAMMDACDTVYFLAGWQHSQGATLEMEYATAKGMKIVFQKNEKYGENIGLMEGQPTLEGKDVADYLLPQITKVYGAGAMPRMLKGE